MSVKRLCWALFSLSLLWSSVAFAQGAEPCADLSAEEKEKYLELGDQANETYVQEDYAGAVSLILEAMAICDEDPRTSYNLARAYHRANDCNMALFWYEQVLEWDPESPFVDAVKKQRAKAGRFKTELQVECANSARVSVQCSNTGVRVTLGEFSTLRCPYEGRLDAGTYKLRAHLEGYEDYVAQVQLVAGDINTLLVPALKPQVDSTLGTLKVSCPEDVSQVVLTGPGYPDVDVPCPLKLDLEPGYYSVLMEGEDPETFEVINGQVFALQLSHTKVIAPEEERLGLFLGVRVAPGVGLVTGDLYDANNEEKFNETLEDGFQPTLATFALQNEIGYAFNENWSMGGQGRFEFANFALMGLIFGRWTPVIIDWWSLSLSLGAGGGWILPTVETQSGQRPLARIGNFIAGAGVSSAFSLSRIVSIVVAAEPRVGYPDLGVHFDFSLGVQLDF